MSKLQKSQKLLDGGHLCLLREPCWTPESAGNEVVGPWSGWQESLPGQPRVSSLMAFFQAYPRLSLFLSSNPPFISTLPALDLL